MLSALSVYMERECIAVTHVASYSTNPITDMLTLQVVQGDTGPICKLNDASSVEGDQVYAIGKISRLLLCVHVQNRYNALPNTISECAVRKDLSLSYTSPCTSREEVTWN